MFFSYLKKCIFKALPQRCVLCSGLIQQTLPLCAECYASLPWLSRACIQCAMPLVPEQTSLTCGNCLKKPPVYQVSFALFLYQPPISKLILSLKFNNNLLNAKLFGQLLVDKIRQDWYQQHPLPDLILPVPLHRERLQERGFNQAIEIARPISRFLKIPIDSVGIKRIKATQAQTLLTAKERKQNLKQAFISHRNYQEMTVAIVDDVVTSGTTVQQLAKILRKKGANSIHVWSCARAIF